MKISEIQKKQYEISYKNGFHNYNSSDVHLYNARLLCLIHSEVSEALEELRKKEIDLNRFVEELADVILRTCDLAEKMNLDLEDAIVKKLKINEKRVFKHNKRF